jgi:hypothetical protein
MTITDYVAFGVKIQGSFLPGCYAETVPSFIVGYWIAPVITETLLFTLACAKALPWMHEKHTPPTLMLLARDSSIYFFVIFILLLSNLLVFKLAPPFFSSLMVSPSNAASCIAGSRMLFNLRGLHYERTTSHIGGGISIHTNNSEIVYRRPTELETGSSGRVFRGVGCDVDGDMYADVESLRNEPGGHGSVKGKDRAGQIESFELTATHDMEVNLEAIRRREGVTHY